MIIVKLRFIKTDLRERKKGSEKMAAIMLVRNVILRLNFD